MTEPAFQRILCAVDGTVASVEAARQAMLLAEPESELTFISVAFQVGTGATAMADVSPDRASDALAAAVEAAGAHGLQAKALLVQERDATHALLEAAAAHDLLVLGNPHRSRREGIVLGATASAAAHRAPVPVLLARPAPGEEGFPRRIVVGSDAGPASVELVQLAAALARRHAARVTLVHSGDHEPAEDRHRLAEEAASLFVQLGVEPIVVTGDAPAHRAIVEAAQREDASLILLGSRGLHGIAAFASVGERVAHGADCSVLIVRGARVGLADR